MGARRGGGARLGGRPTLGKWKQYFSLYWGLFPTFSPYGGLFATFFSLWRPFSPIGVLFPTFFPCGGPFLGLSPPPPHTKISAGVHVYKGINRI